MDENTTGEGGTMSARIKYQTERVEEARKDLRSAYQMIQSDLLSGEHGKRLVEVRTEAVREEEHLLAAIQRKEMGA
jgi:cellobiose-specific phosphotransferase system component IIA